MNSKIKMWRVSSEEDLQKRVEQVPCPKGSVVVCLQFTNKKTGRSRAGFLPASPVTGSYDQILDLVECFAGARLNYDEHAIMEVAEKLIDTDCYDCPEYELYLSEFVKF